MQKNPEYQYWRRSHTYFVANMIKCLVTWGLGQQRSLRTGNFDTGLTCALSHHEQIVSAPSIHHSVETPTTDFLSGRQ